MIVEFGHFALILALLVAAVQVVVPAAGASLKDERMMRVAEPAAVSQLLLLAIAFFSLMYAYVTSDFSVANVVANSHSTKPLIYKMAGVWGNHEGSMLLWVLILSVFGAAVALFGNNLPPTLKARVLSVQGAIALAFLLFTLLTSNPFIRLDPAPSDGNGLNPDIAGPGARVPSAVSLHGLRRFLDRVLVCDRGAVGRSHRCCLGALGQALDTRRLDVPDHRHRDGLVVGLL